MRGVFLAVLLVATTHAQGAPATGRIAGVVTDAETGAPLPGANVWLEGTRTGAAADIDGRYEIDAVPVGTHPVQVSFVGFRVYRVDVEVRAGEVATLDAVLVQDGLPDYAHGVCQDSPLVASGPYTARVVRRDPALRRTWCRGLAPTETIAETR